MSSIWHWLGLSSDLYTLGKHAFRTKLLRGLEDGVKSLMKDYEDARSLLSWAEGQKIKFGLTQDLEKDQEAPALYCVARVHGSLSNPFCHRPR